MESISLRILAISLLNNMTDERNGKPIENDLMDKWYMRKFNDCEFWFLKTKDGRYCRLEPCKECLDKGLALCAEHSPLI